VIFMGQGRAKQGHDAVSQHLVHRALIAMHGIHHALQGWIKKPLGGFRVEIANQFRRAFEVREQHRDLLALAFQGAFGEQDLLDEICGHGGQRWLILTAAWSSCRRGSRAFGTRPDEAASGIVAYLWVGVEQLVFEIAEGIFVEGKLPLPGAVGQAPSALEHGYRLVENLLKGHRPPFLAL
jgi:hypothetical protein